MRKTYLYLIAVIVTAYVCMVSCGTTYEPPVRKIEQARILEIQGTCVVNTPTIADLEVQSTRVYEKYTISIKDLERQGIYSTDARIGTAKVQAVARLLDKHKADILVDPRFSIEADRSQIEVNVSGYPATHKNFRSPTDKDKQVVSWITGTVDVQSSTTDAPATQPQPSSTTVRRLVK